MPSKLTLSLTLLRTEPPSEIGSCAAGSNARAAQAFIDGYRWIGLDRRMTQDAAAILEQILTEADALIRQRLEESGLEVMHVILAPTQDGMGVVRTNVGPELLRSMGEELVDVSGRIEPPRPGDAKH